MANQAESESKATDVPLEIIDGLNRCHRQARGILSCMVEVLGDHEAYGAAWAALDIIEEATDYADRLFPGRDDKEAST